MEKQLNTLEEVRNFINSEKYALLFVAGHTCSVCHALEPQVDRLLTNYPDVQTAIAYIEDIPELAGEFLIFTVPVVILFEDGKRMDSMARFVPIADLDKKLTMMTQ
ncbi:thioredoxin family protein [Fundicoccus culcitae]|uniref:Thioredoxin family protein n=1 Tax=Fundicoccus culcitae TaxID=2969821 RepID=A0ABY5PA48_9LACT|nr:thioredoxin family protein [Fundicoccus culcitae]UUX35360.1 thioredoxin family protein [Fundicoccus culcitae]